MNHPDLDNLNEHAIVAIKRAETLLSMKQSMVHLDNIWGSAGPLRPVKTINKKMTFLLKEYRESKDIQEAQRCLRELEVPHYHHELVYEAIVMSLEGVNQQTEEAMCTLLKSMDNCCLISPAMMEQVKNAHIIINSIKVEKEKEFCDHFAIICRQGFQRVFDDMADIVLDVPLAYVMLDRFVERCSHAGFLSDRTIRNMPTR